MLKQLKNIRYLISRFKLGQVNMKKMVLKHFRTDVEKENLKTKCLN